MSFFFNNFIFALRLIKIKRQRSNGKEYGVKEVVECLTGVLFLHSAKIFRVLRIMSVGFLWIIGLENNISLFSILNFIGFLPWRFGRFRFARFQFGTQSFINC